MGNWIPDMWQRRYAADDSKRVDMPLHVDMGGVDEKTVKSLQNIIDDLGPHHPAVDHIIRSMDAISARADELNRVRREHLELIKNLKDVSKMYPNQDKE